MIRHSVILKFKPELGDENKVAFLEAAAKLNKIPHVKNLEVLKQISPKNDFEYGISMEFENDIHYKIYSNHSDHQQFIQNFWIPYVSDFLEIDFITAI